MAAAREKIDVLIPAIDKDLGALPYVIDAIRKHVLHPIGSIYIVSPNSQRIKKLCQAKGCRFVNERDVLPVSKSDIRYSSARFERSGWLLQQLLKLSGNRVCRQNAFLVIDADTVLIRDHIFIRNNKTVYYCRGWSQPEYSRMYKRLLGRRMTAERSFVSHYMLYEKKKLTLLQKEIEARHGAPWYKAILRKIDRTKLYAFSEFETYGNFVHSRDPNSCLLLPSRSGYSKTPLRSLSESSKKGLARRFRALSYHARAAYFRKRKPVAR